MLPLVGIEPRPLINLWFQVQHYPLWTNWAFTYKTETLWSFAHALLIIAKSSQFLLVQKSNVYKQKFKDPLSSTWQISPARIVLHLESEV